MDGARSLPWPLLLLALTLPPIWGVQVQHTITQSEFFQRSEDSGSESDQYMFDFDGDEIFHVEKEETVWRLREFQQFATFEAQGALQNLAIDKQNLQTSSKAYNYSRAPCAAPEVAVFPKQPVLQDEPNVLICSVTKMWPPVLGLSWFRNGVPMERAQMAAPEVAVFPKQPVLQDEPNVLICSVTKMWPPVLGLSWFRNGVPMERAQMAAPEVAVFPKQPVLQDEPNVLICSVTKMWPPVLGLSWFRNGVPMERAQMAAPEVAVFPKQPVLQDEPNVLICSVTKMWPPVLGLSWFRNGVPMERAQMAAPEVAVFPKQPVLQDEPNVLICSVTKMWPPVLGLSWFRNGVPTERGVLETPFYPDRDNSFRKFSYLTFIPQPGDYYDCRVEHEGLEQPRTTHWEPQILAPASEATETVICALGLAAGIAGVAAGTALIVRGMKIGRAQRGTL